MHVRHHLHNPRVRSECRLRRRALVVRLARRNGELGIGAGNRVRDPSFLRRRIGNREAQERPVDRFLPGRRVVQLELNIRARANQLRGAVRPVVVGLHAWHIAGEPAHIISYSRPRATSRSAGALTAARRYTRRPPGNAGAPSRCTFVRRHAVLVTGRLRPVVLVVRDIVAMRNEEQTDMVSDRQLARLELERRDPRVLREAARHCHAHPFDHVLRWPRGHLEVRQPDNQIGLDLPAVRGPRLGLGRGGGIALRRAGVHPLGDRVDLVQRQRAINDGS